MMCGFSGLKYKGSVKVNKVSYIQLNKLTGLKSNYIELS
jgi:hypothetical protein